MTKSRQNTAQPTGTGGRAHLLAILAGAVVTVQVLFVFCLAYPPLHAAPHGVPIGVAGPPSAVARAAAQLQARPEAFDVHRYRDAASARAAIRDRDVYGAFAVTSSGPTVLVASAADPKVAEMLSQAAGKLGAGQPAPIRDVVPAPAADPQGVGALTTLLPLVLLSIVLGAALALLAPFSGAVIGWCTVAAAVAGLAVSGIAAALGTFTGAYWADAGVLALLVFAIAGTSAGLTRRKALRPLEGLFALTLLLLGIPASGALVPLDLLPEPWRAIAPGLPPAAALDALRGVTFFDGAGIAVSVTVLVGWSVLGVILVLAPMQSRGRSAQRRPVRVEEGARLSALH